jgi:hypothetical protein
MWNYDCSYGKSVSIVGGDARPHIGSPTVAAGEERRI